MKIILVFYFFCSVFSLHAQNRTIAITIDDVPNTIQYRNDHFEHRFLSVLDSMRIPFTIFVNEGKLTRTKEVKRNRLLLQSWIQHKQATVGNHTYSHSRYSTTGLTAFTADVVKGEKLTRALMQENGKTLRYFRFPFNDRGNDSTQHAQVDSMLAVKGYLVTPFTIESSDYMFSLVYEHYLQTGETAKALATGELYVQKTLELVAFYDSMSLVLYQRPVKQIYLCHDNPLNTVYLPQIIKQLQNKNYTIIGLDEAMSDPVYAQKDVYYQKWGISWFYRWMSQPGERKRWMQKETGMTEIEGLYNDLNKK